MGLGTSRTWWWLLEMETPEAMGWTRAKVRWPWQQGSRQRLCRRRWCSLHRCMWLHSNNGLSNRDQISCRRSTGCTCLRSSLESPGMH